MAGKSHGRPSAEDLVRSNPKVDLKQLETAQKALAELRDGGLTQHRSMLTTPYGQRTLGLKSEKKHEDWVSRDRDDSSRP
jgi:hypothetical protein